MRVARNNYISLATDERDAEFNLPNVHDPDACQGNVVFPRLSDE